MNCVIVICLFAVIASSYASVMREPKIDFGLENRILGGHSQEINLVPYQVAISHNDLPLCSGSIIAPKWILTAAHCLSELKNYPIDIVVKIRAGSENQFSGGVVIPSSRLYIHRLFDEDTFDSDIALIQLSQALVYNETIQPIALPERGWDVPIGAVAKIAGWGKSESQFQTILLRATEVITISKQSCQNSYGSHITDRMICAGFMGGGRDFCVGDDGGPLVVGGFQYGIISHGFEECASDKYPGIYTNVLKFLDFIYDTTKGRP